MPDMQIDAPPPTLPPAPPHRTKRTKATAWTAVAIIAASLAAAVVWLGARAALDRVVDNARADMAGRGVALSLPATGGPLDGFPLAAVRRFAGVEIAGPDGKLTAAQAEVAYEVLRPQQATLTLRDAALDLPDGRRGTAATVRLSIDLTQRPLGGGGSLPRAGEARLSEAVLNNWRAGEATAGWRFPDVAAHEHTQPGLLLSFDATGVVFDATGVVAPATKETQGKFSAALTVMGAPPALTPAALEAWRTDGGVVELTSLRGDFPPLAAEGDFTLALDRDLQLVGAGGLRLTGVEAALDLAAKQPDSPFKPKEIKQARQIAVMLTQPDPQGGAGHVALPLSIQDRRLFVGPFQLLKLPPLVW
jgi:hypothetical protein